MSAGHRAIWFNRLQAETVFVDIRPETHPTVLADTTQLPFPDNWFDLIVFDPPHMTHGEGSTMAKYYSAFPAEVIRDLVQKSGAEAFRVVKTDGLMAFKWNDHDVRLPRILLLMEGWEPLFGQKVAGRSLHRSGSYWVLLRKKGGGYQNESQMRLVLNKENTGV
jgi:SAM-dependent methyltransferase